eukprot:237947-Hanusia_phi.AAC.1
MAPITPPRTIRERHPMRVDKTLQEGAGPRDGLGALELELHGPAPLEDVEAVTVVPPGARPPPPRSCTRKALLLTASWKRWLRKLRSLMTSWKSPGSCCSGFPGWSLT